MTRCAEGSSSSTCRETVRPVQDARQSRPRGTAGGHAPRRRPAKALTKSVNNGRETMLQIREETSADHRAIQALVHEAFRGHPHHEPESNPVEHLIVDALREAGALTLSLVAQSSGDLIGHVAFSPVQIDGASCGWYGLGPVAVRPDRQRQGVGSALIENGLSRLRAIGASGVVLVGEPGYYQRFGFRGDANLTLPGVAPEYAPLSSVRPPDSEGHRLVPRGVLDRVTRTVSGRAAAPPR